MKDMTNKEAILALKWQVEFAKETGKSHIDGVYVKALDLAVKALENQPQWIPLSKYHPPKNAYYLTSTIYHEVYCDYWNGMNFDRTEAVLAWMPLPEPYTEEEQS